MLLVAHRVACTDRVLVALRAMRWSVYLIGLAALTSASLVVPDSSRTSGFDVDDSIISQQEESIVPEQQLLQQQDIDGYGTDPARVRKTAPAHLGTGFDQVVQITDMDDSIISQQEESIVPEQQFLQQQDIEGYGTDPARVRKKNQVGTGLVQLGDGSREGEESAEDLSDENSSGSGSSGSAVDESEAEGYAAGYAEGYAAGYAEVASELSGSGASYGADYSSNCDCSCHNDDSYACTQWPDNDTSATLGSNSKCGTDDGCFGEGTFCYNGSDDHFGCGEEDNMSTCCTADSGSGSLR